MTDFDVQPQTDVVLRAPHPMDISPAEFRGALARRGDNRRALIEWVRSALVDGTDYGSVPTKRGPSKPSLRKPGAEKICGMLGVTATFPTIKEYERAALDGVPINSIILRCHLISQSGEVVADGIGARSVEQDGGDLNKALKMACKSAHIDATLRMAGLSEIFTQDLEDMKRDARDPLGDGPPPEQERRSRKSETQEPQRRSDGGGFATQSQVKLIYARCKAAGVEPEDVCREFHVEKLNEIEFDKVNSVLDFIRQYAG